MVTNGRDVKQKRVANPASPQSPALAAIAVERLRKEYDLRPVLRGVTFALAAGQTLVLLGPNGAGKTTLLRILATLTKPSGGAAYIHGRDIVRDADAIRRAVGYVGHAPLLYDELSAAENLRFFARMYGLRDGAQRAAELLDQVGLRAQARAQVRTLSRGQAQRLALARALIHNPTVLLLDEPDTGLDDAGLRLLDQVLRKRQAQGRTTVLATHAHAWGLALADEALVLVGGRVAHAGPAAELSLDAIAAIYAQRVPSRRGGER
jgi:heme ABC exporter ATP-binding subunit CcmA